METFHIYLFNELQPLLRLSGTNGFSLLLAFLKLHHANNNLPNINYSSLCLSRSHVVEYLFEKTIISIFFVLIPSHLHSRIEHFSNHPFVASCSSGRNRALACAAIMSTPIYQRESSSWPLSVPLRTRRLSRK